MKFQLSFKLNQTTSLIDNLSKLTKDIQDQLCLGAIQCNFYEFTFITLVLKNEYEEAIEIYKKIYMDKKYDAINIYLSMCYYKLEFYDVSLDLVNKYLQSHSDSIIGNNLKAAIEFSSTSNEKAAQMILLQLQDNCKSGKYRENNIILGNLIEDQDLIRHNMAVYDSEDSGTSSKLKVFSQLIDIIPEAKLNLVIYYVKNDQINQAYNLIKDLQPSNTKEYIIKGKV